MNNPLLIGLTGGIGSGKSTVANLFAEKGTPVICADQVARELVEPGTRALLAIKAHFGPQVLTADGQLDRSQLRQKIFERPAEKAWLEALLHPLIRLELTARAEATTTPYVLLDIPLLVESGGYPIGRILVVDVPEPLQLERASQRDSNTPEQIQAIIATQATREQRLAAADDVIDNSGSQDALRPQVDALHAQYLTLAKQTRAGSSAAL